MDTATNNREHWKTETLGVHYGAGAETVQPIGDPAAVDFETRLALASAGMDATLAFKHGATLATAQAALAKAQAALQDAEKNVWQATPTKPEFQPHPVLKAAGDVIRARGWIQDEYTSPGGAVCAMSAIRTVLYGDNWFELPMDDRDQDAVEELLNRIASDVSHTNFSIAMWNDQKGQTREGVLRLLY